MSFVERREAAGEEPTRSPQVRDGGRRVQSDTCLAANICLAIDESGSVCSIGSASSCTDLAANIGVTDANCDYASNCAKFNIDTKNFVKAFIDGFEDKVTTIEPTASVTYGIVSYSTDADNDTPPANYEAAADAKDTVDNLLYEGGYTNIQDAIIECATGLNLQSGGENIIVLIGDGTPTTCNTNSGCSQSSVQTGTATTAANSARNDAVNSGIQIATVAISTVTPDVAYLAGLASSSSLAFNTPDFTGLSQTLATQIAAAVEEACAATEQPSLRGAESKSFEAGGTTPTCFDEASSARVEARRHVPCCRGSGRESCRPTL